VFLDITASSDNSRTPWWMWSLGRRGRFFIPLTVAEGSRGGGCAEDLACGRGQGERHGGSAARPELIRSCERIWGQAVVLGDRCSAQCVQRLERVHGAAGRHDEGIDAVEWARRENNFGAGEILLDVDGHDGVQTGFD